MSNFNLATFIVGILSLIGVIINIVFTAINNKKKRYTDLITQRRLHTFQRIIDSSSACIKSLYGIMTDGANENALVQSFIENKEQIFYCTNYKAAAEKELRDALTLLQNLLVGYIENKTLLTKTQKAKIFETIKKGTTYYESISCVYCKSEWVRIKETTISVKDSTNTQTEYFNRIDEIKDNISANKKALYENTFETIVKSKKI